MDDIGKCHISTWRKDTLNKDQWRARINKHVHVKPIHWNIKSVIHDYKGRAQKRRANRKMVASARIKVTEILAKNQHNEYTCPKCRKSFKPQGITNHVKSCAENWCKKNGIIN
jgi:adenosyl cobinamide kinase/adenosyl cobinamide phosphate guanylyltransferase